jgi:hypothetical protein
VQGQAVIAAPSGKLGSKSIMPGLKPCPIRAAYLLKELIDGGDDAFVKFIHNMDTDPLLNELDYGYDLAVFFTFTQHIQYVKTGGLAFISDYQGMHLSLMTILCSQNLLTLRKHVTTD